MIRQSSHTIRTHLQAPPTAGNSSGTDGTKGEGRDSNEDGDDEDGDDDAKADDDEEDESDKDNEDNPNKDNGDNDENEDGDDDGDDEDKDKDDENEDKDEDDENEDEDDKDDENEGGDNNDKDNKDKDKDNKDKDDEDEDNKDKDNDDEDDKDKDKDNKDNKDNGDDERDKDENEDDDDSGSNSHASTSGRRAQSQAVHCRRSCSQGRRRILIGILIRILPEYRILTGFLWIPVRLQSELHSPNRFLYDSDQNLTGIRSEHQNPSGFQNRMWETVKYWESPGLRSSSCIRRLDMKSMASWCRANLSI